jgi:hypothetical protein
MLLGLPRDGLVTQLSHAGYLGEELAKAQIALQLGMRYDQDRPLKPREVAAEEPRDVSTGSAQSKGAPISPVEQVTTARTQVEPQTLTQFEKTAPGERVDIVVEVTRLLAERALSVEFLDMEQAEPFAAYHRTARRVEVNWSQETKFIMGQESEIQPKALVRIVGRLLQSGLISGDRMIILTQVARIVK